MYPIYWLFNKPVWPDIYFMEDVTINESGGYHYHIRFYDYAVTDLIQIDYLNVDTDDSNNVKKCVHTTVIDLIASFYRRLEFYVRDKDGVNIDGASIHVIDDHDNEYNTSTDENGYAYLDCLEQVTEFETSDLRTSVHDPQFDIHYKDFVITIEKNTYQTYRETIEYLIQDVNKVIALQALNIQDRVYPEVEIDEEPTTIALIEIETE